jgi:hypothetical protein
MDARGPAIDVSNSGGGRCWTYQQHPPRARHRRLQLQWWSLPDLPAASPRGPPSTSPTPMVAAARPIGSTPRGPAINVSNSGGGHCRTCRQHPPGSLPSTSLTPVVAAVGPADSTPQGALHQRRQLRWWSLPDLLEAPPGARHRRRQLWWWPLPDLPVAPPRGPAIDVSLNLVPAARIFLATPTRGPPR